MGGIVVAPAVAVSLKKKSKQVTLPDHYGVAFRGTLDKGVPDDFIHAYNKKMDDLIIKALTGEAL